MNLRELLENAHLDALGLLDPEDRPRFISALAAAPASVKAHIRDEQARLATHNGLMPDVQPSPLLRERIVSEVAARMLEAQLGQTLDQNLDDAPTTGRGDLYHLRKASRVSWLWRAGSVGLAGVCAVLGIAFINVLSLNADMRAKIAESGLPKEVTVALGSDRINDTLFDAATRRDIFAPPTLAAPVTPPFAGFASLLHNQDWDDAILSCKDFPQAAPGTTYRVVILDAQGNELEHLADLGEGGIKGIHSIKLPNVKVKPGVTLAIVTGTKAQHQLLLKTTLA